MKKKSRKRKKRSSSRSESPKKKRRKTLTFSKPKPKTTPKSLKFLEDKKTTPKKKKKVRKKKKKKEISSSGEDEPKTPPRTIVISDDDAPLEDDDDELFYGIHTSPYMRRKEQKRRSLHMSPAKVRRPLFEEYDSSKKKESGDFMDYGYDSSVSNRSRRSGISNRKKKRRHFLEDDHIPIDWSIKTKISISSNQDLFWVLEKSYGNPRVSFRDEEREGFRQDFFKYIRYYMFPDDNATDLIKNISKQRARTAIKIEMMGKWSESLTEVFELFKEGKIPYFYVVSSSVTIIFICGGVCGEGRNVRVIINCGKNYRKLKEDIEKERIAIFKEDGKKKVTTIKIVGMKNVHFIMDFVHTQFISEVPKIICPEQFVNASTKSNKIVKALKNEELCRIEVEGVFLPHNVHHLANLFRKSEYFGMIMKFSTLETSMTMNAFPFLLIKDKKLNENTNKEFFYLKNKEKYFYLPERESKRVRFTVIKAIKIISSSMYEINVENKKYF